MSKGDAMVLVQAAGLRPSALRRPPGRVHEVQQMIQILLFASGHKH